MTTQHFTPDITDNFVRMHEQYLVPAIYAQWAHRVAEIAEISLGQRVLDVACRTGTLARAVQLETGLSGKVTGLDTSEKMLASAQRQSPGIEWQQGDATSMPFQKNHFDRVMCQFSLMFIANRVAAIKEMLRVCKPDGLVVLATWGQMDQSGAYGTMIDLVRKYAGARVGQKLSMLWSLGKPGVMDSLLLTTKVNEYECHEREGQARFPSMKSFIDTHLQLAGEFDNLSGETYQKILTAADVELHPFLTPGGQLIAHQGANIFVVKDV